MSDYFVVVDPGARSESFVAGFGELGFAISFAAGQREVGRELVVLDAATGEQVYPKDEEPNERPPRESGIRFCVPQLEEE